MALNVIELFGGIGAFTQAVKSLDIPINIVDYVEINPYSVKSYNAINGTDFPPKDITQYHAIGEKYSNIDVIMHGSPCQDFSVAGKQKGGTEGSGTRSSLLYETIRIVEECKPKVVIWENVPNLVSSKFRHVFMDYVRKMIALGYRSYYKVLNAKDYGIPQNRERVFTVSILGGHKPYVFPEKEPLHLRLIDLLEKNVDESYYLSDKMIEKFTWTKNGYNNAVASQLNAEKRRNAEQTATEAPRKPSIRRIGDLNKGGQKGEVLDPNGIVSTITSTDYKQPKQIIEPVFTETERVMQVGNYTHHTNRDNPNDGRVYAPQGIAPTLNTMRGGNLQPSVMLNVADDTTAECQQVGNVFGNDGKEHQSTAVYNVDGVAPTVCALANKEVIKVAEPVAEDADAVGCAIRNRDDGEHLEFRQDNLVSALHGNIMKSMVATPEVQKPARQMRRIGLKTEQTAVENIEPQMVGGVGEANWGTQYHQGNRVYDANGIAVTLASQGGGLAGGSTELYAVAETTSDDTNVQHVGWVEGENGRVHQSGAVYGTDGVAHSQCVGKGAITRIMEVESNVVGEAKCLRPVRTEQGKAMRKQYEAGEIDAKWSDMRELEPRPDDCTNTLTTVQKDNLIAIATEPVIAVREATVRGFAEAKIGDSIDISYIKQNKRRGRVQDGIAHTLVTSGNEQAVVEPVDPFIVASRGRNPENPSDRTVGAPTTQHLEANSQGLCNTLTTVQKDNYVCEPQYNKDAVIVGSTQAHATVAKDGIVPTLTSAMGQGGGHVPMHNYGFRIRKLTELECWLLMGFSKEAFTKASKVCSKSRLYEQAGNSIVTNCLQRMLVQLLKSVEFEGLKDEQER